MTEKTKKLSDRVREVLETLLDAAESLLSPAPAPVPVRIREPRLPQRRRR